MQGEGDYVSARRYNERTAAFVRRMSDGEEVPQQPAVSKAELARAEKEALARSKGRAEDRKDAGVMRAHVTRTAKKPARKA